MKTITLKHGKVCARPSRNKDDWENDKRLRPINWLGWDMVFCILSTISRRPQGGNLDLARYWAGHGHQNEYPFRTRPRFVEYKRPREMESIVGKSKEDEKAGGIARRGLGLFHRSCDLFQLPGDQGVGTRGTQLPMLPSQQVCLKRMGQPRDTHSNLARSPRSLHSLPAITHSPHST